MRRPLIFAAAALAVVAGVYALWPRTGSPEEQVRTAVREMEEGLGARDAAKVLEHVSEAFHSPTLGDRKDVQRLRARIDWREFGGAPLLGIDGVAVVAHGRSDARAIKNAIRVTKEAVENELVGKIRAEVGKS